MRHLLKVKMPPTSHRMARRMQRLFRSGTWIAFTTLLPFFFCVNAPAYAQAQEQPSPPAQLPGTPPPTKSDAISSAPAPVSSGNKRLSKNLSIKGDSDWADTGIDVQPSEHVSVTAKGTMRYADAKTENGPDGLSRGFKDLLRILPYNAAGRGALIGRVGDADVAQPFLLGTAHDVIVPVGGRLSIAINQSQNDTGTGSYTVHIDILAADKNSAATFTVAKNVTSLPGINDLLFEKIPRRIADKAGNPGDMVNFLILGTEDA